MRSSGLVRPAEIEGPLLQRPASARRLRHVVSGSAATALVLALSGCAVQQPPETGVSVAATSRVTSTESPHDWSTPSATSSSEGTSALATAAMRAFCRPQLTRPVWIAGLDPYLTLAAASAYATVQPSRVACTRVIATAHSGEGDGFTRLVTVPTDGGQYRVMVTRASASERWLVFRIAPVTAQ